jgi:hypothetical protein
MAPLYDQAWLFQRLRRELRRPQNDQALSKEVAYEYLTEAQDDVFRMIAAIAPEENYGAPVAMTTTDGGYTYQFGFEPTGEAIEPLGHVEVYSSLTGLPLVAGSYFDPNTDYVIEGSSIRFPGGRKWKWSTGPFARFAKAPPEIDDDTGPVLQPFRARTLIVHRAAEKWAGGPGKSDPSRHREEFRRAWLGVPEDGIPGLVASLKTRHMAQTSTPVDGNWWDFIDTGEGYQRYG